ncbi:MAG: methylated-DNA--[protein]-cysteine S-methyltransferase [Bdellovibrionales bacterium]|nr:methylated-DNA--[protein]-cysteine S-methyltransferase [Bdellovibrionales bacterium]
MTFLNFVAKAQSKDFAYSRASSPVGELGILVSDLGLHAVFWEKELDKENNKSNIQSIKYSETHPMMALTRKQLCEYFTGKRFGFSLPLVMEGTAFQKSAWEQLLRIPYGETISYLEQATRLGDSKKARAVGVANSKNPISIVVPCHRVIAKSGELAGFGGGIENKRILLDLERKSKRLEEPV